MAGRPLQLADEWHPPTGAWETVMSGMPVTRDHPMHPPATDRQGNMVGRLW
jgi:hypothetical protein